MADPTSLTLIESDEEFRTFRDALQNAHDEALVYRDSARAARDAARRARDDAEAKVVDLGAFGAIDGTVSSFSDLPSPGDHDEKFWYVVDESTYYRSNGSSWTEELNVPNAPSAVDNGMIVAKSDTTLKVLAPSNYSTSADAVQAAIDEVSGGPNAVVQLPDEMLPYDPTAVAFDPSVHLVRASNPTSAADLKAYGGSRSRSGYPDADLNDDAFDAAISRADQGAEKVVVPAGEWAMTDIPLVGVNGVTMEGHDGAVIRPRDGALFITRVGDGGNPSKNVTIRNLVFDNIDNTKDSNNHLIHIADSENTLIEDCVFKNILYGTGGTSLNGGDGIYIRPDGDGEDQCQHVTIRHCKFVDIARQGVSVIQGEHIVIADCYFSVRRAGVDVEPNADGELCRDIVVRDCTADGKRPHATVTNTNDVPDDDTAHLWFGFEATGTNVSSDKIRNVTFRNCKVWAPDATGEGRGFQLSRVVDGSIIDCTVEDADESTEGIVLIKSVSDNLNKRITVEGLTMVNCGGSPNIRVYNSLDVTFQDLRIENSDQSAINGSGERSDDLLLSGSHFVDVGDGNNPVIESSGIRVSGCLIEARSKTISRIAYTDIFGSFWRFDGCVFRAAENGVFTNGIDPEADRVSTFKVRDCEFYNVGDDGQTLRMDQDSSDGSDGRHHTVILSNTTFVNCDGGVSLDASVAAQVTGNVWVDSGKVSNNDVTLSLYQARHVLLNNNIFVMNLSGTWEWAVELFDYNGELLAVGNQSFGYNSGTLKSFDPSVQQRIDDRTHLRRMNMEPRDVLSISSPIEGLEAYHDGTNSNTVGPCFYDGGSWVSLVDGSTIS